jgi:hypothetical protein
MIYETFIEAAGLFAGEIGFLAKALSDDETRPFMQHIHIEMSEKKEGAFLGAATDGRRLHIVDPLSCIDGLGLAPGEWRRLKADRCRRIAWIAKIAEKDAGQFPAWRRVIPTGEPAYTTQFNGLSLDRRRFDSCGLVKFIREFPEPTVINLTYLADLGTDDEWDVSYRGNTKALVFESGNIKAVIMPMQPE